VKAFEELGDLLAASEEDQGFVGLKRAEADEWHPMINADHREPPAAVARARN